VGQESNRIAEAEKDKANLAIVAANLCGKI
jgi:hypothetical protein